MLNNFIEDNLDKYKRILNDENLNDQQKGDIIRSLAYILDYFVESAFQNPKSTNRATLSELSYTGKQDLPSQNSNKTLKRNRTSNRLKYTRLLQKEKSKYN